LSLLAESFKWIKKVIAQNYIIRSNNMPSAEEQFRRILLQSENSNLEK